MIFDFNLKFLVFFWIFNSWIDSIQGVIRITCIGDSITNGTACSRKTYVPILQSLFGEEFRITNAGAGGRTLLKQGLCNDNSSCSYLENPAWQKALQSNPDIITIMLGTNDAKTFNWNTIQQNTGDFYILDYIEMIQTVQSLRDPPPEIFLLIPPPVFVDGFYAINQTIVNHFLPLVIQRLGDLLKYPVINIHSAFLKEVSRGVEKKALACDGCHPTMKGHELIARTIHSYLLKFSKTLQKSPSN